MLTRPTGHRRARPRQAKDPGSAVDNQVGREHGRAMGQRVGWLEDPPRILAQAPESPWGFPPKLFGGQDGPWGALHRMARRALGRGTVLDVGCGGGAASVPLAPPTTELIGADSSPEMLDSLARAAAAGARGHTTVLGEWPVANRVGGADAVLPQRRLQRRRHRSLRPHLDPPCQIEVVVDLTESHPSTTMGPLWMRFWGLPRPAGPRAQPFSAVLQQFGIEPEIETEAGPAQLAHADPHEQVAFVRRRLCLDSSRDPDIAEALEDAPTGPPRPRL